MKCSKNHEIGLKTISIFYHQTLLSYTLHVGLSGMINPSADIAHLLTDALYSFAKLDVNGFRNVIHDISKAMPPFLYRCSTVDFQLLYGV